jgi:hypothetical protein
LIPLPSTPGESTSLQGEAFGVASFDSLSVLLTLTAPPLLLLPPPPPLLLLCDGDVVSFGQFHQQFMSSSCADIHSPKNYKSRL